MISHVKKVLEINGSKGFFFFFNSQRFLCGGRLIFGPEVLSLFLSTFLIAAPAAVFCSVLISKIIAQDKFHWIPVLAVAAIITISVCNILYSFRFHACLV